MGRDNQAFIFGHAQFEIPSRHVWSRCIYESEARGRGQAGDKNSGISVIWMVFKALRDQLGGICPLRSDEDPGALGQSHIYQSGDEGQQAKETEWPVMWEET